MVVTHSPSNANAQNWLAEMAATGREMRAYEVDVSDYDACQACAAQILADVGRVDILVNNAGITRDMAFKKMDKPNWDAVMRTNLDSVFNLTKPLCEGMVERGWGRIINISSVNGSKGAFGQTNYAAAKAGMHGFTKSLALEVARKGVTVNTVSPATLPPRWSTPCPRKSWTPRSCRKFRLAASQAGRSRSADCLPVLRGCGLRDRVQYRHQRRAAHAVRLAECKAARRARCCADP